MATCVYDNPDTMAREAWADGKMIAHITATLMLTKGFNGHPSMPFYLNQGPWNMGQMIGDKAAMKPQTKGA